MNDFGKHDDGGNDGIDDAEKHLRSDPDQINQPVKTKRSLFKKGQSGNPGGRPRNLNAFAALARDYSAEAIETLVGLMRNKKANAAARVRAAQEILDRGFGKAPQQLQIDADFEVKREPISAVELSRRVYFALYGNQERPDPSRAIDQLALSSPAAPEAVPATLEHEPAPTPMPQPSPSTEAVEAQDEPEDDFGPDVLVI